MREEFQLLVLAFFSTLILTVSATSYFGDDTCSEPLVYRAKLSATSHLQGRTAQDAVIESGTAWTPENSDFRESLTIDLREIQNVTEIATRGRSHSNDYVKEYTISFGFNGLDYALFKESDGSAKLDHAGLHQRTTTISHFSSTLGELL